MKDLDGYLTSCSHMLNLDRNSDIQQNVSNESIVDKLIDLCSNNDLEVFNIRKINLYSSSFFFVPLP